MKLPDKLADHGRAPLILGVAKRLAQLRRTLRRRNESGFVWLVEEIGAVEIAPASARVRTFWTYREAAFSTH